MLVARRTFFVVLKYFLWVLMQLKVFFPPKHSDDTCYTNSVDKTVDEIFHVHVPFNEIASKKTEQYSVHIHVRTTRKLLRIHEKTHVCKETRTKCFGDKLVWQSLQFFVVVTTKSYTTYQYQNHDGPKKC